MFQWLKLKTWSHCQFNPSRKFTHSSVNKYRIWTFDVSFSNEKAHPSNYTHAIYVVTHSTSGIPLYGLYFLDTPYMYFWIDDKESFLQWDGQTVMIYKLSTQVFIQNYFLSVWYKFYRTVFLCWNFSLIRENTLTT